MKKDISTTVDVTTTLVRCFLADGSIRDISLAALQNGSVQLPKDLKAFVIMGEGRRGEVRDVEALRRDGVTTIKLDEKTDAALKELLTIQNQDILFVQAGVVAALGDVLLTGAEEMPVSQDSANPATGQIPEVAHHEAPAMESFEPSDALLQEMIAPTSFKFQETHATLQAPELSSETSHSLWTWVLGTLALWGPLGVAAAGVQSGGGSSDVIVTPPSLRTPVMLTEVGTSVDGFVVKETNGTVSNVAAIGDINGDGMADILLGQPSAKKAYVIFGQIGMSQVKLEDVATGVGGFVLSEGTNDFGVSIASLGDVNGDGLADIMVGATNDSNTIVGKSYVIFGKSGSAPDISNLVVNGEGISITGSDFGGGVVEYYSGKGVAGPGDVNGDGLDDFVFSEPQIGATQRVYVIFGQSTATTINPQNVLAADSGFVIRDFPKNPGWRMFGVGDMNGDGLADVFMSSVAADPSGPGAYVIFGQTKSEELNVSDLKDHTKHFGVAITGMDDCVVSAAGDFNGDGLADAVVNTWGSGTKTYVVFGRGSYPSDSVARADMEAGNGGFVIQNEDGSPFQALLSSAGDMNGDGLADVVEYSPDAGRAYVIFGRVAVTPVELSDVSRGIGGFALDIPSAVVTQKTPNPVSAGDINGDGLSDLLFSVNTGNSTESYVVFGSSSNPLYHTSVDWMGDANANKNDDYTTANTTVDTAQSLVGGLGDDTIAGKGGADVLFGGNGHDTFILTADNVLHLSQGVTDGHYARIDGGTGIDTIKLDGAGINLNLTRIANQMANASRIEGVEKIDLTGSGANTLTLSVMDVMDMAGMNMFNGHAGDGITWNESGWSGAALGADAQGNVRKHQLVVDGDAGDKVRIVDFASWTHAVATVTDGATSYDVYTYTTGKEAMLLIAATIDVNDSTVL